MESTIMDLTLSQEIWAVIAIFLLLYIIKDNRRRDFKQEEREKSYQMIINQLTEQFSIWNSVKNDVDEIREYILLHKKPKKASGNDVKEIEKA